MVKGETSKISWTKAWNNNTLYWILRQNRQSFSPTQKIAQGVIVFITDIVIWSEEIEEQLSTMFCLVCLCLRFVYIPEEVCASEAVVPWNSSYTDASQVGPNFESFGAWNSNALKRTFSTCASTQVLRVFSQDWSPTAKKGQNRQTWQFEQSWRETGTRADDQLLFLGIQNLLAHSECVTHSFGFGNYGARQWVVRGIFGNHSTPPALQIQANYGTGSTIASPRQRCGGHQNVM